MQITLIMIFAITSLSEVRFTNINIPTVSSTKVNILAKKNSPISFNNTFIDKSLLLKTNNLFVINAKITAIINAIICEISITFSLVKKTGFLLSEISIRQNAI